MIDHAFGPSVAACAVGALVSIPYGYTLASRRRGSYELVGDEDEGEISRGKSSRSISQRVVVILVAGIGTTAVLWSLLSTGSRVEAVQLVSWCIILVQEIVLATRRNAAERYSLGRYSALSSLAIGIATIAPYAMTLRRVSSLALHSRDALVIVQFVAAVILVIVNLALPRGPDIYRNGRIIDAQNSVSFLNRYTFSWAFRTLALATRNRKLNPEDLPLVSQEVRAQTLSDNFFSADSKSVQWRKWFKLYWRNVVVQVTIQLCSGSVRFLPNVLLLTILRLFEDRDAGANNQLRLWLTALGLGMSMITSSWLISLRNFVADLKISLPVNEQLFAVVTKKAMGLKDIVLPVKGEKDDDDEDDDDEDEEKPQTKDSILNLLGVDVEKISDFIAWSHLLLDCTVEFTLTITFLVYLMGWKATVAGCALPVLLTPAYYTITKKYSEKEQALMERRDEKSSSLTEMVRGIRQIKFSATESEWYNKIQTLRGKELEQQRAVFKLNIALAMIWAFGPICMSFSSLVAYSYFNGGISPSTAFTALSLFENLQNILGVLPEVVTDLLDARVSLRRIARFLGLEDHADDRQPGDGIAFKDATIAWPASEQTESSFQLKGLNLELPTGGLTVVCGRSGAGKSLLLQSLIGEADVVKGALIVPKPQTTSRPSDTNWLINGSIAYVSQDPWIENATIRDSILFDLPMNPSRYDAVLSACALEQDLRTFPDGDKTDIGANGINLSGGQKWRLALARALYSRASILVLDDIFSAVDAHVGRHLFENALTGRLAEGRTRVLATHHVKMCLGGASYLVKLDNSSAEPLSVDSTVSSDTDTRPNSPDPVIVSNRRDSVSSTKKFYEEEKRETGVIKAKVYKAYVKASGGYISWTIIAALLVSLLVLNLALPYWVSLWTRSYETDEPLVVQASRSGMPNAEQYPKQLDDRLVFYGSVYLGISVLAWVLDIIRLTVILHGSLQASKTMFNQFTIAVLHAPLRFLDTTPVGQILNRFTSDFGTLDSDLSLDLSYAIHPLINILGISVAASVTSPLVVGLGILALLASWKVGSFYVTGAREAKRLESTAKSPIFDLVGSLVTGLPTIRAFRREGAYLTRMYDLIDTHCQALWHRRLFSCWVEFWLSLVGAIFVSGVTMAFVGIRTLDAPLAGFALSFALEMSSNIDWLLRQYSDLEINSNAAERIVEYTKLEQEPQSGLDVPAAWPTNGQIEISNLSVGYAPGLPPVLKNLNLSVRAGERVGIVGRTGAGKSSFAMTLLRCLDIREGEIHIDGIDISKVKLHDLRSRVGMISQDPIVFGGTVREVLDPFRQHDDAELNAVLEKVSLCAPTTSSNSTSASDTDSTIPLSHPIAPSGKNLSQGQRQLLTLARALVSRPKILIMDEATASIDMASDQRIQHALRSDISGCTLFVIAHRLSTIADFDRVVVLDQGVVREVGSPRELMGVEDGVFRGLVEGSGEREVVEGVIFGRE
ncbi:P-loop containing nucleoside triphosphate hydrolase protein [Aspergillus unguis]